MRTIPPWLPWFSRLCCLVAFLLLLGAFLAYAGNLTGASGAELATLGLAALALGGVVT